jgi:membrane protease YdiL (CAAX protease family)
VPQETSVKKYVTSAFASGEADTPSVISDDGISRSACNTSLLTETALVAISAILAIRVFRADYFSTINWLATPAVLAAAALIPTVLKRRKLAQIGFNIGHLGVSLRLLFVVCLVVFPATSLFLWVINLLGIELPLRTVLPPEQGWFSWLLYQFLYVAAAEEIFFRGYIQSNVLRLTDTIKFPRPWVQQWAVIIISAGFFAAAHIVIQGHIIAAITFLPGLVLGWLFARTKSLPAPILFHGLANTYYCLVLSILA